MFLNFLTISLCGGNSNDLIFVFLKSICDEELSSVLLCKISDLRSYAGLYFKSCDILETLES